VKSRNSFLGLTIALLLFAASAAQAQAPGWSRGQQNLSITYDECLRRIPLALQGEGYRIDNISGDFGVGIKNVHTAVIICSPAPESKMFVHVVVASNGEGGGIERQRLQARMEGNAPSSTGDTSIVGVWTWAYAPPGQQPVDHGTVTASADGSVKSSAGDSGSWRRSGSSITLTWTNGSVDTLNLSSDGRVMSGTNNAGWSVRGTKQ